MKFVTPLSEAEKETLRLLHENHSSSRVRNRAFAILLSSRGNQLSEIAILFSVGSRTVSSWIDRFEESGIVGLYDQSRPPKLTPTQQEKVVQWARQSPKNLKKVALTIKKETNKTISRKTIKRILKKNG